MAEQELTGQPLHDQQLLRYSRQIMLPQLDVAGQQKLCASRALVVGLGGLGSPVAMYLAAAGVGTLVLNDFDTVDLHNLQRQIVHTSASLGMNKTASAKQQLLQLNPDCQVIELSRQLDEPEMAGEIANASVVVDCTDNFATRVLLNHLCHHQCKPLVSGAAIRFEGQVTVFHNEGDSDACYRCLYPQAGEEDASCSANGVLAPVVGVIGSLQAVEVIKLIAGIGETLRNRLLIYDALHQQVRVVNYKKDPACPLCGNV